MRIQKQFLGRLPAIEELPYLLRVKDKDVDAIGTPDVERLLPRVLRVCARRQDNPCLSRVREVKVATSNESRDSIFWRLE